MNAILLLFALLTDITVDTGSPWPYQHVDKQSKLSNSAITSVYMDQYNHVWLGTWDGLDRYDGSSIKVYKPDPFLKGTISNNVIRNFLEDGYGNLWIITHQGINKYDRTNDSFSTYLESVNDIPFLEYNIRACIGADSTIWTSLIGKGISRYSQQENAFLPITFEGLSSLWLASVIDLVDHNGLLYLLGSDGKLVCTLENRVVFTKDLKALTTLNSQKFVEIGGRYFLARADIDGNVMLYNLAEIEKDPVTLKLGNVTVSSLSENLERSAIWIGTESGDIFKITTQNGKFSLHQMNAYFPAFSKAKIKILTITETSQDLIWVGTDGDGVYKFMTRPKAFFSILSGSPENGQLSHTIIRSVYEDEKGILYIGTRGGGLNIIQPGKGITQVINTRNGLSNNAVLALNKDQQGNLWIGLDGEGIDMIESKSGNIFHFPRDFENSNDLAFSSVYSICVDVFNDVWLGTSGYGMIRMKVGKKPGGKYYLQDYDQLQHSGKAKQISIKSNVVYSIVEERPNMLWFGTRGGGIYRYNALTKEIEDHIQSDPADKNSLSNDDVLSLYIDKQEQLWIGTSGGLNRLHLQTKPYRIEHYTLREGLPNNTIHGILEDESSTIWISTNHGLVRFNDTKGTFKTFDTNDGLQNNEFADGAMFKSRISEKLYFGGVDGLDVVYPTQLRVLNYFPRLTVTDFQVRNVAVTPGDETQILKTPIEFTNQITLNHDQNFISFYFTTLDYWNKQKSEYRYFLENFDKGWNYIGQQQSITLTNIPPGRYTLNINATNENGVWNSKPRSIVILVTPPFWKTSWAYAFYLLIAVSLQAGIVLYIRWRWRVNKESAISKLKTVQLKELNDYKLQFFTNIAHEFRTPLTLILGPIASLLNKSRDDGEARQLKGVYNNSLRLQKLIEELIQFRKIETGKDSLEISRIDLVSFTHNIVNSFNQHAVERDVHLEFHPEPEHITAFVDQKKIEKILINLISNAIKYSSRGGIVTVSLTEADNKANFVIKDEGIGIAEENKEKIFESFYQNPAQLTDANGLAKSTGIGLSLTKSLVLLHTGQIRVSSRPGKGSRFMVSIPTQQEGITAKKLANSELIPLDNLTEKISLEFQTDHYLLDQPGKTVNTVLGKHPYSILVVDDNAQITALLENILSDKYVVHKAQNGKHALELLDEERIDLVISDVLMPDMDGLTLCRKLKENIQTSHIPVILLTAKAEIENRIEGLQVGADSYIPKPFHPEHLFVRIEKLIERMELTRRNFQNIAELDPYQIKTGISERDDIFFTKITQCIIAHLNEHDFNADTVAEEVGMSKASLYKKVKTVTGLTPHGLIKQHRLHKAAHLLKHSGMSVSEVIDEIGFNSRSYFYKSFNEMYHCHPKDFVGSTT